jgi:hypothetical protein
MNRDGDSFAWDASSDTRTAGVLSAGVCHGRLLHVVFLFVNDVAITGCIAKRGKRFVQRPSYSKYPIWRRSLRKRLELFWIFTGEWLRVSLLHANRRNSHLFANIREQGENTTPSDFDVIKH